MNTPFGLDLVRLEGVTAPQPFMRPHVAEVFRTLRNKVAVESGVDFLSRCGDVFREPGFTSTKDGVANRSWHKTGRTFDYNQESAAIVIVSEPKNGKQYFRTFLKCAKQDGSEGEMLSKKDIRGNTVKAYLYDFTAAAESLGFKRIPAWSGWQTHYNRKEFWHYQYDEGLTWDAAMVQLKKGGTAEQRPPAEKVLGLNDRGDDVRDLQAKLAEKKLLAKSEVDGIFGAKTKAAVAKFQAANGLAADGLVGPATRAKLFS